jgi:hypothetical protein
MHNSGVAPREREAAPNVRLFGHDLRANAFRVCREISCPDNTHIVSPDCRLVLLLRFKVGEG